jgi:hypothetical protein
VLLFFFQYFLKILKTLNCYFIQCFFDDFDVIILEIKESENIFKNIIYYITNTHLEKHEKRREKRKEKKRKSKDGVMGVMG